MKINKSIRKKRLRAKFLKGSIRIGVGRFNLKKSNKDIHIAIGKKYSMLYQRLISVKTVSFCLVEHFGKIRL